MKDHNSSPNILSPENDMAQDKQSSTGNRYELNLFEVGKLIVSKRKMVYAIVFPVVFLTALIMFTTPNVYQSKAIILPTGGTDNMRTIKELVGLGGAMNMGKENSSELYPLILQSNLIRDSVLSQEYDITFEGEKLHIIPSEYFGQTDPTRLRKALAGATVIKANKRTGEIYMSVETEYPELSKAILTEYLNQLENYNRHVRKSSARENQRYLEARLKESTAELHKAEEAIRAFREVNSNWASTTNADILNELTRLERDLEIKSSAYLFLQQQLEVAKLNAQKDIPILSILDTPSLPTIKSGPKRVITIFFAGVISFILAVLMIFFTDLWKQVTSGRNRREYETLKEDVTRAFPRTRKILRMIRRNRQHQREHVYTE